MHRALRIAAGAERAQIFHRFLLVAVSIGLSRSRVYKSRVTAILLSVKRGIERTETLTAC